MSADPPSLVRIDPIGTPPALLYCLGRALDERVNKITDYVRYQEILGLTSMGSIGEPKCFLRARRRTIGPGARRSGSGNGVIRKLDFSATLAEPHLSIARPLARFVVPAVSERQGGRALMRGRPSPDCPNRTAGAELASPFREKTPMSPGPQQKYLITSYIS